jgi:hypothetical protein
MMNPELMATKTSPSTPEPVGIMILQQLADLDAQSMSPKTARKLLDISFSASHQNRVDILSEKAQAGSLTPAEENELDEYIRVGDLLAILQSRARQALKSAGLSP